MRLAAGTRLRASLAAAAGRAFRQPRPSGGGCGCCAVSPGRELQSTASSRPRPAKSGGGSKRDARPALHPPRARDVLLTRPPQLPTGVDSAAADPTYVPRDPGVQDGDWQDVDQQLVRRAVQQAVEPSQSVLLGQDVQQLQELAHRMGQLGYRGKQLLDGLLKGARSIADIRGLPAAFKQQLQDAGYRTGRSVIHTSKAASDGTTKFLLQLAEGRVVETVGIPLDDTDRPRLTVCVSSQVGCPMRCRFCATGAGGFARNLRAHEILDQVLTVQEEFGARVSNVVMMGMGEPLLVVPEVVRFCQLLRDQLGLSGRAVTISTVGVPNSIARLAEAQLTATLAVSIHAPSQALREQLIPSAKVYPLESLMADCAAYFAATGRRVTFEYTLLAGVNDEPHHADELVELLSRFKLRTHVNLIPFNPVDDSGFQRPGKARVAAFQAVLERRGVPVSVRVTRGLEAAAACGQLRNAFQRQALESPAQLC